MGVFLNDKLFSLLAIIVELHLSMYKVIFIAKSNKPSHYKHLQSWSKVLVISKQTTNKIDFLNQRGGVQRHLPPPIPLGS